MKLGGLTPQAAIRLRELLKARRRLPPRPTERQDKEIRFVKCGNLIGTDPQKHYLGTLRYVPTLDSDDREDVEPVESVILAHLDGNSLTADKDYIAVRAGVDSDDTPIYWTDSASVGPFGAVEFEGDYSYICSDGWVDTGIKFTLPDVGTYLLVAPVRVQMNFNFRELLVDNPLGLAGYGAGVHDWKGFARIYDETADIAVPRSEAIVARMSPIGTSSYSFVFGGGGTCPEDCLDLIQDTFDTLPQTLTAVSSEWRDDRTTYITAVYTTTEPDTVIRIEGQRPPGIPNEDTASPGRDWNCSGYMRFLGQHEFGEVTGVGGDAQNQTNITAVRLTGTVVIEPDLIDAGNDACGDCAGSGSGSGGSPPPPPAPVQQITAWGTGNGSGTTPFTVTIPDVEVLEGETLLVVWAAMSATANVRLPEITWGATEFFEDAWDGAAISSGTKRAQTHAWSVSGDGSTNDVVATFTPNSSAMTGAIVMVYVCADTLANSDAGANKRAGSANSQPDGGVSGATSHQYEMSVGFTLTYDGSGPAGDGTWENGYSNLESEVGDANFPLWKLQTGSIVSTTLGDTFHPELSSVSPTPDLWSCNEVALRGDA